MLCLKHRTCSCLMCETQPHRGGQWAEVEVSSSGNPGASGGPKPALLHWLLPSAKVETWHPHRDRERRLKGTEECSKPTAAPFGHGEQVISVLNYASHPGMCPQCPQRKAGMQPHCSRLWERCTHACTHMCRHTHRNTHHSLQFPRLPSFAQCVRPGAIPAHTPESQRRWELCFHKQHLLRAMFILEIV